MLLIDSNEADVQKRELRKKFREFRKNMQRGEKQRLDLVLQNKFLETSEYKSRETLLAFVSLPIEVDTSLVLNSALMQGKRLALPRCKSGGQMDFYTVKSLRDLQTGAYGIKEPNPKLCDRLDDFRGALCLVPGLAFDRQGFRLGFGGGYYDRFLSKTDVYCAGLCYSGCVADELPRTKLDMPVNAVITEDGIMRIQIRGLPRFQRGKGAAPLHPVQ